MVKLTSLASVIQYSEICTTPRSFTSPTRAYLNCCWLPASGIWPSSRSCQSSSSISNAISVVAAKLSARRCEVCDEQEHHCQSRRRHKGLRHIQSSRSGQPGNRQGEVCCIIGPSGSGKSTFLRCINQLEKMNSGAIWVGDELIGYRRDGDNLHEISDAEISRQRRRIGMVFQRFNLFPHMTALENIMEGPYRFCVNPWRRFAAVHWTYWPAWDWRTRPATIPRSFSGGQQQRVAIARAMCMQPELILFDERPPRSIRNWCRKCSMS